MGRGLSGPRATAYRKPNREWTRMDANFERPSDAFTENGHGLTAKRTEHPIPFASIRGCQNLSAVALARSPEVAVEG